MDTIPDLNVELLSTLVQWAGKDEARLDKFFTEQGWPEWNQAAWGQEIRNGVCQTACCIAGGAAVQSGYILLAGDLDVDQTYSTVAYEDEKKVYTTDHAVKGVPSGKKDKQGQDILVPDPDSQPIYIGALGRDLLGLTRVEADFLFAGGNNLADVVLIATAIEEARGVSLDIPRELRALPDTENARNYTAETTKAWYVDNMQSFIRRVKRNEELQVN